ncbi:MAG: hypothetical protein K1X94_33575, partial [Sandaracinaceae bacterium]|nr:hypothetical protein [Sandaracinaceae bacterium]
TSAACSYPSSSVACVAGSCTAGTEQPPAYCNAGACAAAPPTKSCGLFACGTLTCKTSCAVDADCVSTAFCNTTTSACEPKKPSGSACTSGSACASGFCASGVCCDKACTGACESCNASGSVGLCQTRPSGTTCGADACVGSSLTVAAKCDGAATTCPAPAPTACPGGLVCADGKTCKTSCATGTDCTSGYCDLATGKCGTPPGDGGVADTGADTGIGVAETGAPAVPAKPSVDGFQRCRKSSECSTGFCVDGVCCDSACGDRCHSCALFTSPGKCTVEPIGVDLRNECGPANQCLGTCDGTGQCIGAGTGTMCGRNRCTTASAGVGAAYCSAPGAKCPLDEATPFECAPFACEPAFGACLTACVSSTDCANGFVCDLASKTCVAPAPAAEDSGCGVHGGAAPFGAWVVALLLAAGARRTRTSTSPRAR